MSLARSSYRWTLLVEWVVANAVGWLTGVAVGVLLMLALRMLPFVNEDRVLVYAVLLSLGLTSGVAQGLVLRPYHIGRLSWLVATLVGFAICTLLVAVSNHLGPPTWWRDVVLLLAFGAAVGVSQAVVLGRRYHGAAVWALACSVSFLGFAWLTSHPAGSLVMFVLVLTLVAMVAALVPGLSLVWLVGEQDAR